MESSLPTTMTTVVFIGNTGAGKSTLCNYFRKKLASPQDKQPESPFHENKEYASTQMNEPVYESFSQMRIVDTPGLSDTGGKAIDVKNLSSTTVFIKKLEEVHAFVFVINWHSQRFDDSTIATFRTFYTSFGNKFLKNVKFLFTKASKMSNAEAETKIKMDTINEVLAKEFPSDKDLLTNIQHFLFECNPDYWDDYSE